MQQHNQISASLERNINYTAWFFIIFYAVGVAGLAWSQTFNLFTRLIPLALMLSFTALMIFHKGFTSKQLLLFTAIFLISFAIESIGVNTALIFGSYVYGDSLGIKLFNTPLIIGLNWLLLVYMTASVSEILHPSSTVKTFAGAGMMLVYDLILEQVAPVLDMWYWNGGIVPIKNYLTWLLLSLVFHAAVQKSNSVKYNRIAPCILVCQVVFFIALYFILS